MWVVRFSAIPTMTVPSADTPLANTSCQPPVETPRLLSTLFRSWMPLDDVQRNARVRPPGGGGVALPTTTVPSADTSTALLQSPSDPRSRMPPLAVQRKAWKLFCVRDSPTTVEPSDEAAKAKLSPPPRWP